MLLGLDGHLHTGRDASHLARDYEVYVSLPPSYGSGQRSYPVVFVTDAPALFKAVVVTGRVVVVCATCVDRPNIASRLM